MKRLITLLIFLVWISASFAQNARIQIIHNAADPAAQEVDVYVNGALALDNFAFRTATPFIDLPAGVTLNIGIAPGNSTSVNDTLKNFQVILEENETYVAVANGVLDPNSFSPNPDGREISFTLFAKDNIREEGNRPWGVDFIVLHGATDAPTVDIIAKRMYQNVDLDLTASEVADEISDGAESFGWGWGWRIVNNAAYGDITNYKRLSARQYILKVTPGDDNNTVVAKFNANLTGLGGGAAVVFASGFLNPAANQNGAAFGIFAALAIFVTSIGILGLIAFMVTQRTKEIGIRKVMGADIKQVFNLLTIDILKLIIISFIVVTPLMYWGIGKWLQSFAHQMNIGIDIFLLPFILTIIITFITIGTHVIRAALANPVEALRYE